MTTAMTQATERASGRRHSAALRSEARRMFEDSDGLWTAYRVREVFRRRGVDPLPAESTIRTWIDDDRADRRREVDARAKCARKAAAGGGRFRAGHARSPEFKLARVATLLKAGVPATQVHRVMAVDFPADGLTYNMVRGYVEDGSIPRCYRRLAA